MYHSSAANEHQSQYSIQINEFLVTITMNNNKKNMIPLWKLQMAINLGVKWITNSMIMTTMINKNNPINKSKFKKKDKINLTIKQILPYF